VSNYNLLDTLTGVKQNLRSTVCLKKRPTNNDGDNNWILIIILLRIVDQFIFGSYFRAFIPHIFCFKSIIDSLNPNIPPITMIVTEITNTPNAKFAINLRIISRNRISGA